MDILISDLNGETVTGRFYEKRIGLEPKLRTRTQVEGRKNVFD